VYEAGDLHIKIRGTFTN